MTKLVYILGLSMFADVQMEPHSWIGEFSVCLRIQQLERQAGEAAGHTSDSSVGDVGGLDEALRPAAAALHTMSAMLRMPAGAKLLDPCAAGQSIRAVAIET